MRIARRASVAAALLAPAVAARPLRAPSPAAPTTTAAVVAEDGAVDEVTTPTVPVGLDEDTILTATYQWGPSDPAVILQELLGITADGWYGNGTRAAHMAELEARGLDVTGVPSPPTTTTENSRRRLRKDLLHARVRPVCVNRMIQAAPAVRRTTHDAA